MLGKNQPKQIKYRDLLLQRREDTLMWWYINLKKGNVNTITNAKLGNVLHHLAKHQHGTCTT